jgi:hypothetical protein
MVVEFDMKYLGKLHYFPGIELWKKEDSTFMSQPKYTWDILNKFNMMSCKLATIPLEIKLKLCRNDESNLVGNTLYYHLVESLI